VASWLVDGQEELVDLVSLKDNLISSLREDLRAERKLHKQDKKRFEVVLATSVADRHDPNADFVVAYAGTGALKGRLTPKSGFAIALRRNIGNASAKDRCPF